MHIPAHSSRMRLEDIERIKQVKYRYGRAIDMSDRVTLMDLFTEDATIRYQGGTYDFKASGRDEIVNSLVAAFHKNAAALHMVHHPVISFKDATTAKGEWTLHDVFYDLDTGLRTSGSAIYKDTYVLTDAGWKIAHSGYTRLIEFIDPISKDTEFTYRILDRD